METLLDVGSLLFGGVILYFGAEWLVKGSAGLAHSFGVKPLVIGLTVVAYATSAPELAVSGAASLKGSSPIVLGNVVGSCIANLGLILGITALIKPPSVDPSLIRREMPVLVLSAIALPVMLYDGAIGRIDAIILLLAAIGFTLVTLMVAASEHPGGAPVQTDDVPEPPENASRLRLAGITLVGLGMLIGGGELFVRGAEGLAYTLGVSERLVGLTVVAVGTSLPELAASLVAAARGYSSMAIGNVVGSNIFNIFLIGGVAGNIRPIAGDLGALRLDMGFLVGITIIGVLFMRGNRKVSRIEGTILLGGYVAFIGLAIAGIG